jgi:hypothetical protein
VQAFQHTHSTDVNEIRARQPVAGPDGGNGGIAWISASSAVHLPGAIAQKKGKLEAQPPSSARRESCGRERGVRETYETFLIDYAGYRPAVG